MLVLNYSNYLIKIKIKTMTKSRLKSDLWYADSSFICQRMRLPQQQRHLLLKAWTSLTLKVILPKETTIFLNISYFYSKEFSPLFQNRQSIIISLSGFKIPSGCLFWTFSRLIHKCFLCWVCKFYCCSLWMSSRTKIGYDLN